MNAARGAFDLVLDLFAGPGGWDQGALPLGLSPIGIEWDDAACRTGKAAGHHRVRADVSKLSTAPMVGKVTGLIASPPCQTFSMAGKGAGRDALPELQGAVERVWKGATPAETCPPDLDVKSVLVLEPVRYARDLRPEWIALEQVPAVLPIWQAFAIVLRHNGYSAWCGVLNSADYGVPQTRQRAILIASRVRKVQPPPPTHTKGGEEPDLFGDQLAPWVSMAAALGWGMHPRPCITITAGGSRQGGPDPLDGGSGGRETLKRAQREGAWVVRTGNNSMVTGRTGSKAGDGDVQPYERPVTEPAPTVDCGAGSKWTVVRTNNTTGTGYDGSERVQYERTTEEPAPTLNTRTDLWSFVSAGVTGEGRPKDPETQPADTLTGKGTAYWYRSNRETGKGGNVPRPADEPAPTVDCQGQATWVPEAAQGSVRVTVQEAAVLQSFPPDYPWQGSRTKQFEQVGNAVPPGLALHVLCAVTGLALPASREVAA